MKSTTRFLLILGVLFSGISSSHGDPVTYNWGGGSGDWSANGSWTGGTAPPPGAVTANGGGGAPNDTIQFNNAAASTYTSTYDFTLGTPQSPYATFFNLNQLNLNGGQTSGTGNNIINRDPLAISQDLFDNLRFADNGGGIVNSTDHGVGYTVQMAVLGINTLNLSGNGTSLVSLSKGVFADVVPTGNPPSLSILKTGTSTFEINGTLSSNMTTNIREGAIQLGTTGTNSLGPINLGNSSGSADARLILPVNTSLGSDGDITVVNSAGGGTRTIQSTATGLAQGVSIAGDIAINYSGGLRIDSGLDHASVNLTGAISGSGDLIVAGAGVVRTTGIVAFTGSGKIVVESGSYENMRLFGGTGTGPVTLGNGASAAGMNFANSFSGATYEQPITIAAGGARDFNATENGTLTGGLTFNNGADFAVATGKAFVIEGVLSGATGGLEKRGAGTLTLSGATPSSPGYTAPTTITEGTLKVNRDLSGSAIIVASGATLGGSGSVGAISGGGTIAPGNSPGITTAPSVNPIGGLDFLFQITQLGSPTYGNAGASGNDVLRLTGGTPFTSSLNGSNTVTVDFTGLSLAGGQQYRGGFYADSGNFFSSIQNGDFSYVGLGGGQSVTVSTVQDTANFGAGNVNGWVTEFTIVAAPEPGRVLLLVMGSAALLLRRRRA